MKRQWSLLKACPVCDRSELVWAKLAEHSLPDAAINNTEEAMIFFSAEAEGEGVCACVCESEWEEIQKIKPADLDEKF